MKNLFILIVLFAFACGSPEKETEKNPESLVGTWQRQSYVDNEISDTTWVDQSPKIIYLKHITPTHFAWLSFDTETEKLNATGGGTYIYDGNMYTENIEFFYPTTSSLLGMTIPFEVKFKDGLWHHSGYIQNPEFDTDLVEVVAADSSRINEIWTRIDSPSNKPDLVGTWELVSYKNRKDSTRIEFPKFINYYKLITPTYFHWIHVNTDDNEVSALGGGTYDFDSTTYTEHILYHHPVEEALRGISVPFKFEIKDNQWYHTGTIVRPLLDSLGNQLGTDTLMVDEIWKRLEE